MIETHIEYAKSLSLLNFKLEWKFQVLSSMFFLYRECVFGMVNFVEACLAYSNIQHPAHVA